MKNLGKLLVFIVIALMAIAAVSAQNYDPATTKVALVPIINDSADPWQELKDKQKAEGTKYLVETLATRGFVLVNGEDVNKAIAKLGIDFNDDEQRTRANLFKVGNECGATLVFFVVIVESKQTTNTTILTSRTNGFATVKLTLVDANKQEAIFNAVKLQGKSTGGGFVPGKGSERQVVAVRNTINDILKKWLESYPVKKT
ncbi:MAG: hypothetical protein Q7K33_04090 [Candidatus Berkelbacteria bacterium]|nr:hypothetical protein [Candidatus Berkelbacteria bacterium]